MEAILNRSLRLTSTLGSNPSFLTNNAFLSARCLCCTNPKFLMLKNNENNARYRTALRSYFLFSHNNFVCQKTFKVNKHDITLAYSNNPQKQCNEDNIPLPDKKLSIFKRMKQLTKDYWYILVPVHIATSMVWVTIFYVAVKNGVDIVTMMEHLNLSEKYLNILRSSGAGNWAIIYALYKIFTPARYAVTIGGTTMSIRYLNRLGYLKASSFKKAATNSADETLRRTVGKMYGKAQTRI
ncbi:protein FAM210A isoform X2 [Vespula pensylvanica]|uniref:protein FAM210A isoform X2 n=1 Tax=Vespula pensylvanica TaxID=30213 RepID=UPI001CB9E142|nr:protein FAM210A isoform X2 [Vespula pensylvanica]